MASEDSYSIDICNKLKKKFHDQKLHRPMRVGHYDKGTKLSYNVKDVEQGNNAHVDLEIEKFVGGGFAGQVYRVKILDIKNDDKTENNQISGLEINGSYAMKILIPPSGFALMFRNLMYRIGFQAPFQLQVNPTASRAGALWQKLIRKGAKIRFGTEKSVNDIHATFVDDTLGSCGEFSDWVEGRTWRLEVDDRLDLLKKYLKGKLKGNKEAEKELGSPEYRAKKKFMTDFVQLLQDMGAHEFARQYEWTTCKSQPNVLKLNSAEDDPEKGLTAVDFRAGLALLPFLPMSPGDIKLIFKGFARGSLVQFDRGNLKQLKKFMDDNKDEFSGMAHLYEELTECESVYRNSIPDITHNFFRLFYSKKLWSTLLSSTRTGWRVQNIIDNKAENKFKNSFFRTFFFYILGAIPILGGFLRKIWARADWRNHYKSMLTSWRYLKRSFRAKGAETVIVWHRDGRLDEKQAEKVAASFGRFVVHLPFSFLPIGLHKFFTKLSFLKDRLYFIFVRPVKLYFSAEMREEWLRDMVKEGRKKHILDETDAKIIEAQLDEPYIQKYLKSLAVHVCTLPVTQIVSVLVSVVYWYMHPEIPAPQKSLAVGAILALFQVTPVSPGSLVRGLYVVYMMIKDRNFKDYNIAVFLGFFKYIGYLAFPIQMTYRYPELARFMAGHWATEAVHIVPVFGEHGALLERWVFNLFYNWPLTLRMRMRKRAEAMKEQASRYWHVLFYIIGGTALLGAAEYFYLKYTGIMPELNDLGWLIFLVCVVCGAGVTLGCGGAPYAKRFIAASVWGILTGICATLVSAYYVSPVQMATGDIITAGFWRVFVFAVLAAIFAVITELRRPAPEKQTP